MTDLYRELSNGLLDCGLLKQLFVMIGVSSFNGVYSSSMKYGHLIMSPKYMLSITCMAPV